MRAASHPHYDKLRPRQQGLADLLAESTSEESLPLPLGWGKTPTLIVAAEAALSTALTPGAGDARLLILTRKITVNHWLETWSRFSAWFAAGECVGPSSDETVVITSYDNFSRHHKDYLSVPWTRAIADEPPAPVRPSRRQQALLQLQAQVPCWLVGPLLSGAPATPALAYLLGDVPLPPYRQPGPRSRPSLLAERSLELV